MNINFKVNKPLKGHDEDALPYADNDMLVVCDGLAGSGQNTYIVDGVKYTSAYLGSRQISKAFLEFMKEHMDQVWESLDDLSPIFIQLHSFIQSQLDQYVEEKELKNFVRGRSMQMLPSTLAAVLYKSAEDHTDAVVVSAGDSRVYMLTPEQGLQQLSKDDVDGEFDAYEKSSSMNNNISQDREYHINYSYFRLPAECILFVCSDGCFDYMSSPIELEFCMDYSVAASEGVLDPDKNGIGEYFGNILVQKGLKDDCTVAGVVLGYENEKELRQKFLDRAQFVKNNYRDPWAKMDQEVVIRKRKLEPGLAECLQNAEKLKMEIFSQLETCIVKAWEADVSPAGEVDVRIRELLYSLRDFQLYKDYMKSEQAKVEEASNGLKKYEKEYRKTFEELKNLFKEKQFEEYLVPIELIRKPGNILMLEERKYRKNCKEAEYMEEQLRNHRKICEEVAYMEEQLRNMMEQLRREFPYFSGEPLRGFFSFGEIQMLSNSFQSLHYKCVDYETVHTKRGLSREQLRQLYIMKDKQVEKKFEMAMKNCFQKYEKKDWFPELESLFMRCKELDRKRKNVSIPTKKEQRENFQQYLKLNFSMFIERIRNNPSLFRSLCGKKVDELIYELDKIKEIKNKIKEPEVMQRKLWMHYKSGYEYYRNGKGGIA